MVKTPSAEPAGKKEKKVRSSAPRGNFLWVVIFRLLLLGVGGSLAAFIGMAIAQLYPDKAQEPPLVEIALRQAQNWLKQLPSISISQFPPVAPPPSASPAAASPPVAPPPSASPPSALSQSPPPQSVPISTVPAAPGVQLSPAERDKLQAELNQVQSQLQALGDRASTLQNQLTPGQAFNSQPIATPVSAPPVSTPANTPANTPGKALVVTLPSDTLFNGNGLRPETLPILDSIISDLQRYPGASVQVAAHLDQQGSDATDRTQSFEQARAVKHYLSAKLGATYQWTAVGYGHSRPLTENQAPLERQRNRRIEIKIDPP